MVLTDPTVSRHHCSLRVLPEGYFIRDDGSTNGTRVNGTRVIEAFIDPGSVLCLGTTDIRFDRGSGEVRQPISFVERYDSLLGRSKAMRRLFAVLPRIATSAATVLLTGDTGTGKGLLAEVIHRQSPRSEGPFVVVDCGAIPANLIETELFGHEKGAFTGAHTARAGAFEAADNGTLFLDELGELPLDLQPKLLRALEERKVKRVGSNKPIPVNVRVIAATNRDVRQAVNRGNFRSDLYYRLNTITLRIPPLRERREDIPLLVQHFYSHFAEGKPAADLVEKLSNADWPGNVRELRSAVERAVLMGDPGLWSELSPAPQSGLASQQDNLDAEGSGSFDPAASFRAAKERAIDAWEAWYLRELLRRHEGNLSRAARAAQMDRKHLRELLRKHRVDR
jgi:DNA-binding NtrC family response regulator